MSFWLHNCIFSEKTQNQSITLWFLFPPQSFAKFLNVSENFPTKYYFTIFRKVRTVFLDVCYHIFVCFEAVFVSIGPADSLVYANKFFDYFKNCLKNADSSFQILKYLDASIHLISRRLRFEASLEGSALYICRIRSLQIKLVHQQNRNGILYCICPDYFSDQTPKIVYRCNFKSIFCVNDEVTLI